MQDSGHCYFCDQPTSQEGYCFGCAESICEDCDEAIDIPIGHHVPEDHRYSLDGYAELDFDDD